MGEDDEGGCQGVWSKPKSVIHRYFNSNSDNDDNYPDNIDEFEYKEDGHVIFPF